MNFHMHNYYVLEGWAKIFLWIVENNFWGSKNKLLIIKIEKAFNKK